MKTQFKLREVWIVAIALTVAQVSSYIFGIYSGWFSQFSVVVVMTAIFIAVIDYLLNRLDANYSNRIEANEAKFWDVWMNGVKVGSIADADYAMRQQLAFRDGRNALAQLLNAGRVAMNVLGKVYISVPLIMFWGALAIAAFTPESFKATVQEFQKADSEVMLSSALVLLKLVVTIASMIIGLMASFGHRFGFTNCYSTDVSRLLRIHCNVPAEGDISLRPRLADQKPE